MSERWDVSEPDGLLDTLSEGILRSLRKGLEPDPLQKLTLRERLGHVILGLILKV